MCASTIKPAKRTQAGYKARADREAGAISQDQPPGATFALGSDHGSIGGPGAAMNLLPVKTGQFSQGIAKTVMDQCCPAIREEQAAIMILGANRVERGGTGDMPALARAGRRGRSPGIDAADMIIDRAIASDAMR